MDERKDLEAADYVVGHGRPPKATQFAPGKSGNPRGRPRGSRTTTLSYQRGGYIIGAHDLSRLHFRAEMKPLRYYLCHKRA
jgi:hypothetical protein